MKRQYRLWLASIAVLAGLPTHRAIAATNEREVEEDQSLATRFATPHKNWAKGYVGGPVRALFIVHAGGYSGKWFAPGTRLREVVELGERFDLEAKAIFCGGRGKGSDFLGGDLGKARAERLLKKPYDVYVMAGYPFEKLPAKSRFMIMERVSNGAGLVCCGPKTTQFMIAKRRIHAPALTRGLPPLSGRMPQEFIDAYRLGKGRGAHLKYSAWTLTPREPFSWRGLAEYDYRMLWVGRAVLWAAGREGNVAVELRADQRAAGRRAQITVGSRLAKPLEATVAVELRRACDGRTQSLGERSVKLVAAQPSLLTLPLPRLRAGDYFVDAVVSSPRGVEACGATVFTATSDFGVEQVELSRPFVERGERLTGKATLRGALPATSVLRIRFRDSHNRVLRQRNVRIAAGQTTYPFDYQADAFATILMRAEALLLADGQEVEMKTASFTVPKRRRRRFNFLQWDTPRDVLGYYAWRQLKKAGMSCCLLGSFSRSKPVPVLQASDISLVPYSTRILDPKDERGYMKPCCWNDEPKIREHVQKIVDNQAAHRRHGVWVYSLGDEGVTKGCCVCPACIAAYRRYLAGQYGTIDTLNASWGSKYNSFAEVDLLDHKDNMEREALAKGLWARWFDRQAFARVNLLKLSGRFVAAYTRLDPKAVTGFEGTGRFGDDYDAIIGTNTFYSPYPSIGDDIVRSIAPRSLIRANWMGYSKAPDPLIDAAWRMVIKGMDSVWYWMWTGVGSWRGYLTPTLDFAPAIQDLAEEMRPVREGLGDLLLQSQMIHSGIAVYYSVPSALSGAIENSREFISPQRSHETWARLTYDAGLDFRYVTSATLKRGVLNGRDFRVALLSMAQAIPRADAEAIRRFVRAGGVVIADVRPGIYDGHCKPISPGALDDVFGIKRAGRGSPQRVALALRATLDGRPLALQATETRVDPGVEPTSAQVLAKEGGQPALLVNHFGAGRAILLNFQVLIGKDEAEANSARRFVRALYRAVGARSAVAAAAPDGGPLPMTEMRIWRNGGALVFGLWRKMECKWFGPKTGTEPGEPVPVKLALPSPRHVYDLRAGRYLGAVTEFNTTLRWGRANFFLALPHKIDGLQIRLSSATPACGETLKATLALQAAAPIRERYAAHVVIIGPNGKPTEWGSQVVMLVSGRGKLSLPVAYNNAPGQWRLRATEVFSRVTAEARWQVR